MPTSPPMTAMICAAWWVYHHHASAFVQAPCARYSSSTCRCKTAQKRQTWSGITTDFMLPQSILAKGGGSRASDGFEARGVADTEDRRDGEGGVDETMQEYADEDEPFPIWSGMNAFEDGEADAPPAGVIIVDPFCDYLGMKCRQILEEAGYAVVQVLSEHVLSVVMQDTGAEIFRAPRAGQEASWAACLPFPPVAVLCESDAGLETAERLQAALLGPRFGGISEARRDKFLMNEAVRNAGLSAVRQVKTSDWLEVERFLLTLGSTKSPLPSQETPIQSVVSRSSGETTEGSSTAGITVGTTNSPVQPNGPTGSMSDSDHNREELATSGKRQGIYRDSFTNSKDDLEGVMSVVKPARGCASGGVFLCKGAGETKAAFEQILGAPKYGSPGAVNQEVVVQEFLEGTEYVVDTVSRDGVHKVMAIWRYDKRPANGAPFVYFATKLMASDGEDERRIMEYARNALDALGVKYGPTHTEVMMVAAAKQSTEDEKETPPGRGAPFLVEVNTRWHLTDFAPITDACVGYNAVEETLSAYIDPDRFDALPHEPPTGEDSRHGRVVHLVSYVAGKLESIQHEEEVRNLDSFAGMDVYADPERGGTGEVKKTIDIRSDAGWVHLVHPEIDVVERDYRRIVELMPTMLQVS